MVSVSMPSITRRSGARFQLSRIGTGRNSPKPGTPRAGNMGVSNESGWGSVMGIRDVVFVGVILGGAGVLVGGMLRPPAAVSRKPQADRPPQAADLDPIISKGNKTL